MAAFIPVQSLLSMYSLVGRHSCLCFVLFEQPGDVVFPSASVPQYIQAKGSFRDLQQDHNRCQQRHQCFPDVHFHDALGRNHLKDKTLKHETNQASASPSWTA